MHSSNILSLYHYFQFLLFSPHPRNSQRYLLTFRMDLGNNFLNNHNLFPRYVLHFPKLDVYVVVPGIIAIRKIYLKWIRFCDFFFSFYLSFALLFLSAFYLNSGKCISLVSESRKIIKKWEWYLGTKL